MIRKETRRGVLVVEDIHETRDGIEKLLIADGYRVAVARDVADATEIAQRRRPDLILLSLAATRQPSAISNFSMPSRVS